MSATILHRLADWAKSAPHSPAQKYKINGHWKTLTAKEYLDRVFHLALYLESCGMTSKDSGAILSYNCKEWVHMELALMLIRSQSAGLYPNSTSKDIHYVLDHTHATVLAVQNKDYYNKILADGKSLPSHIRFIIVFDDDTSFSPKAIAYSQAIEEGKKLAQGKKIEDYLSKIDPFAPAFMIYTSGTTGNPKGAVLSHDNLVFTSDQIDKRWKLPTSEGSLFSFLPLCHIAEKLHSIGVGISKRYAVSYCTKFDNLIVELGEVEPTLLLCVPRVWEKMMEGVMSKVEKGKGVKKQLATWALGVGKRIADSKYSGGPTPADKIMYPLAQKLVLGKIRNALGLGNAQLLASGAAPLPAHVAKWFRGLGLEIYECYGLTETTGMVSITIPGVECAGTVGKPLEGCEFKLADDGEICTKGRHVFIGYFNDEANTSASLKDGWFHTGDLGNWTSSGLLKIVGRKREIMKTSGGKMVAPVPIEEKIKESNFISQVCLVGDNRKYFSALVTLSEAELLDLKAKSGAFKDGVVQDLETLSKVKGVFDQVNKTLASFEQVKHFTVLDREFSIDHGEMTPTMKMKRASIEARFKPLIDKMYN
jgi:long-chain acyl-CoA synthetase